LGKIYIEGGDVVEKVIEYVRETNQDQGSHTQTFKEALTLPQYKKATWVGFCKSQFTILKVTVL
jgi:hypothetical protein